MDDMVQCGGCGVYFSLTWVNALVQPHYCPFCGYEFDYSAKKEGGDE